MKRTFLLLMTALAMPYLASANELLKLRPGTSVTVWNAPLGPCNGTVADVADSVAIKFATENACGATNSILTFEPNRMRLEVQPSWRKKLLMAPVRILEGIAVVPFFVAYGFLALIGAV
jgi:hypothetical protein